MFGINFGKNKSESGTNPAQAKHFESQWQGAADNYNKDRSGASRVPGASPLQQSAFDWYQNQLAGGGPGGGGGGGPGGGGGGGGGGGQGTVQNALAGIQGVMGGAPSMGGANAQAMRGMQSAMGLGGAQDFAMQGVQQGPQLGAAAQMGRDAGMGGSQYLDPTARGALSQFAGGQHIGGNPELDATVQRAQQSVGDQFSKSVLPGLNATFGGAGRTGSGLHQEALTDAGSEATKRMGDVASQLYGGAYEQGRGQQLQAAGQLGGLGLQGGQLGLGGLRAGADIWGQGQNRQMQGNQLAGSMFNQGQNRQLQGNQMAANMWGQGQDRKLQGGLGMGQLGMQQQQHALSARNSGAANSRANYAQRMQLAGQALGAGGQQRGIAGQQANADVLANQQYQSAIGPAQGYNKQSGWNFGLQSSEGGGGGG